MGAVKGMAATGQRRYQRTLYHLNCERRLGGEGYSFRDSPRMRPFTSRSEEAHSSSVVSIVAPVIHSLLAMETY